MKKYKINISTNVISSFRIIRDSLYNINLNSSLKFNISFFKAIKSLEYLPNRNPHILKNYRKMLFYNHYIIIYKVDEINSTVYVQYLFNTIQDYIKLIY